MCQLYVCIYIIKFVGQKLHRHNVILKFSISPLSHFLSILSSIYLYIHLHIYMYLYIPISLSLRHSPLSIFPNHQYFLFLSIPISLMPVIEMLCSTPCAFIKYRIFSSQKYTYMYVCRIVECICLPIHELVSRPIHYSFPALKVYEKWNS